MCGRYTKRHPVGQTVDLFEPLYDKDMLRLLEPRYNIAPMQQVPAVRLDDGKRKLVSLRWKLLPFWSRTEQLKANTINARAETVATAASYREPFKRRRCLLPCDGFYEWPVIDDVKVPHFIRLADDSLFSLAGLWDKWTGPDGKVIESCTHITTEPNELIAQLHDRQPVFLRPAQFEAWLDPATSQSDLLGMLKPYPAEEMIAYPVSSKVSKPMLDETRLNDSPDLIDPV
jgi:putative SOS response-associated peptidase YedK